MKIIRPEITEEQKKIIENGNLPLMNEEQTRIRKLINKSIIPCPVCGKKELADFDICKCGWENDAVQYIFPDVEGCANRMSLNQAIEAYKNGTRIH